MPPRDYSEAVRQANPIESVIAGDTPLRKEGALLKGRCILHADGNSASLAVYPDSQSFFCFGCHQGGDVFSWVAARDGVDFLTALDALADRAGIQRRQMSTAEQAEFRRTQLLRRQATEALQLAASYYEEHLQPGTKAWRYLVETRGLTEETIRQFRMGYAPGSQELQKRLVARTIPLEAIQRAGLVTSYPTATSGYLDLLGHAVVVPILEHHQVHNLYGRIITPADNPHRYLHGRVEAIFNWDNVRGARSVILTEAIFDALSIVQAGYPAVTCTYGTAYREALALRLKQAGTEELILAFDADPDADETGKEKKAGQRSALEQAARLQQLGFAVRILTWPRPDGRKVDANRFFVSGGTPEQFRALLDAAMAPAQFAEHTHVQTQEALLQVRGPALVFTWGDREYQAEHCTQTEDGVKATVSLFIGGRLVHKDSVGLWSSARRTAFAKRCSGCDAGDIDRDLKALEAELHKWTSQKLAEKNDDDTPAMSEEEKAEALALLMDPRLLKQIEDDIELLGYVGETANKLMMYFVGTSRKLSKPMSAVVKAQSSSGKSALIEKVVEMIPPEDVVDLSRATPQSLFYMGREALKHRWVVIMERNGSEEADYAIRTMQSEKMLKLAVPIRNPKTGETKTEVIEVEGPMAYAETTTQAQIHQENATRTFDLYINETKDQTLKIHDMQRKARTLFQLNLKQKQEAVIRRHQNAQRLLEPLLVIIPYAELLTFPADWVRTRRDHDRFLDLISTIAFLHQFQRPRRAWEEDAQVEFIEATWFDYYIGYELARDVLAQTLDELPKQSRELLIRIRAEVEVLARKEAHIGVGGTPQLDQVEFTRRDIRKWTQTTEAYVRRYVEPLTNLEFLEVAAAGSKGRTERYRYIHTGDVTRPPIKGLLRPEELEQRMRETGMWSEPDLPI